MKEETSIPACLNVQVRGVRIYLEENIAKNTKELKATVFFKIIALVAGYKIDKEFSSTVVLNNGLLCKDLIEIHKISKEL